MALTAHARCLAIPALDVNIPNYAYAIVTTNAIVEAIASLLQSVKELS